MHVLNLDLDFFLNGRVTNQRDDIHARPDVLSPLSTDEVVISRCVSILS